MVSLYTCYFETDLFYIYTFPLILPLLDFEFAPRNRSFVWGTEGCYCCTGWDIYREPGNQVPWGLCISQEILRNTQYLLLNTPVFGAKYLKPPRFQLSQTVIQPFSQVPCVQNKSVYSPFLQGGTGEVTQEDWKDEMFQQLLLELP